MKPLDLIVSAMQSTDREDPAAPTRVTLVSADPSRPQTVAWLVYDRADLAGLGHGKHVTLTASAPRDPAPAPAHAPAAHASAPAATTSAPRAS